MEQLISQLVEIETKAQNIVAEPLKLRENLDSIIAEESAKIRSKYMERASLRLQKVKMTENGFLEQSVSELEKSMNNQISRMEELLKINETKWVDELFSKITGRC